MRSHPTQGIQPLLDHDVWTVTSSEEIRLHLGTNMQGHVPSQLAKSQTESFHMISHHENQPRSDISFTDRVQRSMGQRETCKCAEFEKNAMASRRNPRNIECRRNKSSSSAYGGYDLWVHLMYIMLHSRSLLVGTAYMFDVTLKEMSGGYSLHV